MRARRRLVLQRHSYTIHLSYHILAVLQWLCKVADGTHDIFVTMEAEWEDGYKAEGKPRIALYYSRGVVALV